ncbi:TPA: hypothetical protein LVL77_002934 [Klebsiella oxytoca]|uniref:hypothetical protein n=1 Tax=Klebsiella oxytoca TaxID=571 RepID=UPI0007CD2D96|nr:hypothetical protein [Klebsiella oxytoca]SAP99575.1 Uncharacterised protein [Klebsiella oxytoca]HBM3123632.1 hypothetical protein [Klebsiella oxytoca]HCD5813898.1 hypothetical protein [Klebsiella oxytoca]HDS6520210.1 hypothetical protein [Klebsiella oxytoca]HDT4989795.1 hypothetical protein [Klebsiella oxytoca]
MTQIKAILAFLTAAVLLLMGVFGLGRMSGREKAEAESEKKRTEENAAASVAAAERKEEATREASNVQQTVSHMHDDDVDRELRENYTRPGGG